METSLDRFDWSADVEERHMHGIEHLILELARLLTGAATDEKPSSFRSPFTDAAEHRRNEIWAMVVKFIFNGILICVIAYALWIAWRDG